MTAGWSRTESFLLLAMPAAGIPASRFESILSRIRAKYEAVPDPEFNPEFQRYLETALEIEVLAAQRKGPP